MFSFQDLMSNPYEVKVCKEVNEVTGYTIYQMQLLVDGFEAACAELSFETSDKELMEIDYTSVRREFQGQGYGHALYREIANLWHTDTDLHGRRIGRCFINPKAYVLARWLIDTCQLPAWTWDEENTFVPDKVAEEAAPYILNR